MPLALEWRVVQQGSVQLVVVEEGHTRGLYKLLIRDAKRR